MRSVTVVIFFLCNICFADINNDLAKCAVIKGDLERLSCFDNLTKIKKLNGPQKVPSTAPTNSKWLLSDEINPVDDSRTVTIGLQADSGQSRFGKPIGLIVRCKSNSTDFYINWMDYLGGDDVSVLIRVGKSSAKTETWQISTDNKAAFSPSPIALLKQLLETNTFLAQVTPYNENPITAVFDVTGLKSVITPLREACNW